jgi:hypothetical protein
LRYKIKQHNGKWRDETLTKEHFESNWKRNDERKQIRPIGKEAVEDGLM